MPTVEPAEGALSFTGQAPTILIDRRIDVPAGSLVLSGERLISLHERIGSLYTPHFNGRSARLRATVGLPSFRS